MRRMFSRAAAPAFAAAAQQARSFGSLEVSPDKGGMAEYSVVYTDRALNHMSKNFQGVMKDLNKSLTSVYKAEQALILPGSGSYGMEAVARQFATGKKCLVVRNGFFSFRWTQIFEAGNIPESHIVMKAQRQGEGATAPFAPAPVEDVVATILKEKPQMVFAPHVETSAGIILPDEYIRKVAEATHAVGGLFVLDGIASGTVWVDMRALGVDVFISAPQKGWTGPACAGLVMLSPAALEVMEKTNSSSFVMDLKKWQAVMNAYLGGAHMYHATMPTDALTRFRDIVQETEEYGLDKIKGKQLELGEKVCDALESRGIKNVAAKGFRAPGVVVSYTSDAEVQTGKKFGALGMQIAGGVPLMVDEGADFRTFRLGLFGLDKLYNVDRTVKTLEEALDTVFKQ